jgi:hypothetical protein
MSSTALVTDASRLSASQNVDNYAAGVQAHINGDWGGHYQIAIIDSLNWTDSNGDTIAHTARLRLTITVNNQDIAVVLPIIRFDIPSTANGPTILTQPISMTVAFGGSATFLVVATVTDGGTINYQWRKNTIPVPGAISPQLAFTNVKIGDDANYDCVVSNKNGTVISATVRLTVYIRTDLGQEKSFWDQVKDFATTYSPQNIIGKIIGGNFP